MRAFFYRFCQVGFYLAEFFLPWRKPQLITEKNALLKLATLLREKNLLKVCIVTDEGIVKAGLLQLLVDALQCEHIEYFVYDKTIPNPTIQNVETVVALYKDNHCTAFIALGGGSPMDCAKAAATRIAKPRKTIRQLKGIFRVLKKLPPLVAIPTTSGTGSETTLAAVISDPEMRQKYAIKDPALIPHYAVLDPTLTVGLPPHITSTTGMDALCHAIESYIGRSNTRATKKQALEAISLVFENLPLAYKDGTNLTARENMQKAAYLAGLAFTRAYVGYVHAIAHTLGAFYHIPHGLANAVVMPYVFRAYGEKAHKKLAELAELVNVCAQNDSVAQKAKKFITAIEDLNRKMNIPTGFEQIKTEDIPLMAKNACKEGNPEYPVPRIMYKKEFESLFEQIRL